MSRRLSFACRDEAQHIGTTIRAIIFDFNNTISPDNFVASFEQHAALLSMPPHDTVALYRGNGMLRSLMRGEITEEEFWHQLASASKTPTDVLMRVASTIRDTRCLDSGVMHVVARLRGYYRLAVLTDNSRDTFGFWVGRYKLGNWFQVILNSAECGMLKGDPGFYRLCLDRLRCEAREAVLVDDSRSNVQLAQSLGLKTILFTDANQLSHELDRTGLLPNAAR